MKKSIGFGLMLSLLLPLGLWSQYTTRFESSNGTQTPTYEEGIAWYQRIAADFKEIDIQSKGLTDSGHPLHLVLYSKNRKFDIAKLKAQGKAIFFINNAIHPGEPDGVDASMMLLRDLALHPERYPMLDSVVVAIIPFYNIGGALNRSATSRVPKSRAFVAMPVILISIATSSKPIPATPIVLRPSSRSSTLICLLIPTSAMEPTISIP